MKHADSRLLQIILNGNQGIGNGNFSLYRNSFFSVKDTLIFSHQAVCTAVFFSKISEFFFKLFTSNSIFY
ncbi:hypothetical protein D3C87_1595060 [compost metagenome]